ncbi:MAG: hypothetical protein GX654_00625 [Desulfatiglans sp.]|nr:hypothetical protein [Desulfatiglans sp.]
MPSDNVRNIANKSVEFVKSFFANLPSEEKSILPSIFKTAGSWVGNFDDFTIGIFYLTHEEIQRAVKNMNQGIHAFPGFYVSEPNRKEKMPVAIKMAGSCNYFASCHTENIIAFSVCQGSSFTVIDHFHEIKDSSGQEFKYRVDLVFFLGLLPNEEWQQFKKRLSELLLHSLNTWRGMR